MTAHTLRYYERIGLIHSVGREPNGHRRYSAADEAWLKFLHWMRRAHMPIRDMLRYSALHGMGCASAPERRTLLENHRATLEAQIANLEAAHALLTHNIDYLRRVEDGEAPARPAPAAKCA
jgi:DNA-binding transcriptional MerR regulator